MTNEAHQFGRSQGRRLRDAIDRNLRGFSAAVAARGIDRGTIREEASAREERISPRTRAEIRGKSEAAGVPYLDLLAYNLFEETILADGCTTATATGEATAEGGTIFFKQSDKKGSTGFEGENHHRHQQINVVRIEEPEGENKVVSVTAAGSTAVKMGVNDQGVGAGSTLSRTTTFEEADTSPRVWAASGRGEYIRQGLLHGSTAVEVARYILPELITDPMASPGTITIVDHERVVVLEGEDNHLASEWVDDGIVCRANKFEILDGLAPSESEIPSSYRRYERATTFLSATEGDVTAETMRDLSVDHENGPGLQSICRHQERDYTDETSLSSIILDVDADDPEASDVFISLGKPCHAWRTDEGEGWIHVTAGATEDDVPEAYLSGEAWREHYSEQPYDGRREVAPLDG